MIFLSLSQPEGMRAAPLIEMLDFRAIDVHRQHATGQIAQAAKTEWMKVPAGQVLSIRFFHSRFSTPSSSKARTCSTEYDRSLTRIS